MNEMTSILRHLRRAGVTFPLDHELAQNPGETSRQLTSVNSKKDGCG
jgi:hypothetical protein